ncbi:MAG: Mov34/MPN/PAD-1 family protein [Asgard group archaeon]
MFQNDKKFRKKVYFYPWAIAKIIRHASRFPHREIAGFLIGSVSKEGELYIFDAMSGKHQGTSTSVILNESIMAQIAEDLEKYGEKLTIVGWYHSHPGLGAHFMSSIDVQTQKVYQSYFPKAVALVIDSVPFNRSGSWEDLDIHLYHVVEDAYKEDQVFYITDIEKVIPQLVHALNLEFILSKPYLEKEVSLEEFYYPLEVEQEEMYYFSDLVNYFFASVLTIISLILIIYTST